VRRHSAPPGDEALRAMLATMSSVLSVLRHVPCLTLCLCTVVFLEKKHGAEGIVAICTSLRQQGPCAAL